jgi:Ala-tRNA(Pro) deacylase
MVDTATEDAVVSPPIMTAVDDLLALLDRLGIEHDTVRHPAVYTVEESLRVVGELPGGHIKNLFLRDKPGRMWILVMPAERTIELKQLAALLGTSRLSFASAARMARYLGVGAGAVTPLAVINDHEQAVTVVIDEELLSRDRVNLHPLENTATTGITPAELIRFLEAVGHPPLLLALDG